MAVNNIREATKIAKDYLENYAGILYSLITKVTSDNSNWIINANSFGIQFKVVISKESGEILEYSQI